MRGTGRGSCDEDAHEVGNESDTSSAVLDRPWLKIKPLYIY